MIKLTYKEIWEAREGLNQLANINMPSKTAYRVARNLRKIKGEFEEIENRRLELAKEHGATPKQGVPPEKQEAFRKEFDEFLKTNEAEVDIQPITEDLLDGLSIPPSCLVNLEKFLA